MNKNAVFVKFLDELKNDGNDPLIESLKQGFSSCFESYNFAKYRDFDIKHYVLKYLHNEQVPGEILSTIKSLSNYASPGTPALSIVEKNVTYPFNELSLQDVKVLAENPRLEFISGNILLFNVSDDEIERMKIYKPKPTYFGNKERMAQYLTPAEINRR